MWTPSICSRPPASSFPGLRKAGWNNLGTRLHTHLICGQLFYQCQVTQTLLHRLDEVGHLLCEASQLLYEVVSKQLLTAIMGCGSSLIPSPPPQLSSLAVRIMYCKQRQLWWRTGNEASVAGLGHKSRLSVGKYNNPTSFNRVQIHYVV